MKGRRGCARSSSIPRRAARWRWVKPMCLRLFDLSRQSRLGAGHRDAGPRHTGERGLRVSSGRDPAALPRGCSREAADEALRPMDSAQQAEALARAASGFPFLGEFGRGTDLLALAHGRTGPRGNPRRLPTVWRLTMRERPWHPTTVLHIIISGNTPAAGLQSADPRPAPRRPQSLRVPAARLPELDAFRSALPPRFWLGAWRFPPALA